MMLYVYLAALVVGGILVGSSILFGGDGDGDFDGGDFDGDADFGDGGDLDGVEIDGGFGDATEIWLPFANLRFWTFLLLIFGLTGTLFILTNAASAGVTLALSAGAGLLGGYGAAYALRRLTRDEVSSGVGSDDYIGATARTLLPIKPGARGKIRVFLKGQAHDLQAVVVGEEEIDIREEVMIVEMNDEVARVAPASALRER